MRRLLRVVVLALLCTRLLYPGPDSAATVLVVSITGVIHPVTVDILDSAIAQAQREGCRLIVLRLNTPGGFLAATRVASQRMLNSPIPIATWVGPMGAQAASAGFYLLEAGDVAIFECKIKRFMEAGSTGWADYRVNFQLCNMTIIWRPPAGYPAEEESEDEDEARYESSGVESY